MGPFTSAPMESSFSGGHRNLELERNSGLGSGRTRRRERWPGQRTRASRLSRGGGRSWWAHLKFARMNIALTIGKADFEELMNVKGIGEKSFLKLKPLVTLGDAKPAPKQ